MQDLLIDRLAETLTPVRPRHVGNEAAILGLLALAEAALLFALGMMRGDLGLGLGMATMEIWKIAAPATLAVVTTLLALRGGDPARVRVGLGPIALVGAVALLVGISLSTSTPDLLPQAPLTSGATARGMACVLAATLFACPPALALGLILSRAAPARPAQTALAASLAAGAFGATLLGLHCPDDSTLHSVIWHPLGVIVPALAATLPLTRVLQW